VCVGPQPFCDTHAVVDLAIKDRVLASTLRSDIAIEAGAKLGAANSMEEADRAADEVGFVMPDDEHWALHTPTTSQPGAAAENVDGVRRCRRGRGNATVTH